MFDVKKEVFYEFFVVYDVFVIEDDIYGDLYFSECWLKLFKVWDWDGCVLLCFLFGKMFVFGLCVGWVVFGCYLECVWCFKFINMFGILVVL